MQCSPSMQALVISTLTGHDRHADSDRCPSDSTTQYDSGGPGKMVQLLDILYTLNPGQLCRASINYVLHCYFKPLHAQEPVYF